MVKSYLKSKKKHKKINKVSRTHKTNDKTLTKTFKYINYYQPEYYIKPNGFWYDINNMGAKYGQMNFGKYKVEVLFNEKLLTRDLDINKYTNKILLLDNLDNILKFNKLYSIIKKDKIPSNLSFTNNEGQDGYNIHTYIKWKTVSKHYAGIEFRNFNELKPKINLNFNDNFWYTSIDFDSGCIWNLKMLKNYIKIKKI